MGENSYSKADSKGAASVLQTDEELTKFPKNRPRETRERQNKKRQSLYSANRERSNETEMDF